MGVGRTHLALSKERPFKIKTRISSHQPWVVSGKSPPGTRNGWEAGTFSAFKERKRDQCG